MRRYTILEKSEILQIINDSKKLITSENVTNPKKLITSEVDNDSQVLQTTNDSQVLQTSEIDNNSRYFYILSDCLRLHRSIFKIGITSCDTVKDLKSRYRTYLENPKVLALISTTYCSVADAEIEIKGVLYDCRINHGSKILSEWVCIDYDNLVAVVKAALMGMRNMKLKTLQRPPIDYSLQLGEILQIPNRYRSIRIKEPVDVTRFSSSIHISSLLTEESTNSTGLLTSQVSEVTNPKKLATHISETTEISDIKRPSTSQDTNTFNYLDIVESNIGISQASEILDVTNPKKPITSQISNCREYLPKKKRFCSNRATNRSSYCYVHNRLTLIPEGTKIFCKGKEESLMMILVSRAERFGVPYEKLSTINLYLTLKSKGLVDSQYIMDPQSGNRSKFANDFTFNGLRSIANTYSIIHKCDNKKQLFELLVQKEVL